MMANKERDKKHLRSLRRLGWRACIIWECQTASPAYITARIKSFLR